MSGAVSVTGDQDQMFLILPQKQVFSYQNSGQSHTGANDDLQLYRPHGARPQKPLQPRVKASSRDKDRGEPINVRPGDVKRCRHLSSDEKPRRGAWKSLRLLILLLSSCSLEGHHGFSASPRNFLKINFKKV